ncbi:MAG: mannosyltransferase, partial [Aquabacterium sp.]
MKTLPKTLHIIWIGDQTQRPDNCIATWLHHHPGWTLKIWGNDDLSTRTWRCERQMLALAPVDLRAVVDLMRWEILADEGGVAVAADSLCLRT